MEIISKSYLLLYPGALGSKNTKESYIVLKIGMLIKKNLEEAIRKTEL